MPDVNKQHCVILVGTPLIEKDLTCMYIIFIIFLNIIYKNIYAYDLHFDILHNNSTILCVFCVPINYVPSSLSLD